MSSLEAGLSRSRSGPSQPKCASAAATVEAAADRLGDGPDRDAVLRGPVEHRPRGRVVEGQAEQLGGGIAAVHGRPAGLPVARVGGDAAFALDLLATGGCGGLGPLTLRLAHPAGHSDLRLADALPGRCRHA